MEQNEKWHAVFLCKKKWNWKGMVIKMQDKNRVFGQSVMGVTTLSLPSMIMLKKAVKPKLLAIFIVICTVGIIIVGYFFNAFQPFLI